MSSAPLIAATQSPRIQELSFAAWLEFRRRGLCSSDIHKLMKGSRTRTSVLRDKTTEPIEPSLLCQPPEDWQHDPNGPDAPQWGHATEPAICSWVAAKLGLQGHHCKNAIAQHARFGWALASPDYLASDAIVEAKMRWSKKAAAEWANGVPDDIECQVRWQLAVLDLPVGYVGVSLYGAPPAIHEIHRDHSIESMLIELGQQAWSEVCAREGV